jgi:hypothetical protein
LTTNIEGRLAALKSSTPVNGFQRLLFLRLISEANASGMVSRCKTSFLAVRIIAISWLART